MDAARQIGDPLVNPLVPEQVALNGADAVRADIRRLFRTSGLPTYNVLVTTCADAIGDVELGDLEVIAR